MNNFAQYSGINYINRRHLVHPAQSVWGVSDFIMVAMVLSMMFSVVNMPLLPVSPTIIFPFLLWFTCRSEWKRWGPALLQIAELRWLLFLYSFMIIGEFILQGFSYDSIAEVGRILAAGAVSVLTLSVYALSNHERFRRVLLTAILALSVSTAWFIMEITVVEPFVSLRTAFYADIYATQLYVDSIRSGLVPFSHLVGYQLAALIPLMFLYLVDSKRKSIKLLSALGMAGLFVALYFSSQRSVFLAIVSSFGLILLFSRRKKRMFMWFPIIFVVLSISSVVITNGSWVTYGLQMNTIEKLKNLEVWYEGIFRLKLQWKALELVWQNPFGLPIAGLSWETHGFWPVYQEYTGNVIRRVISVHNSYLGKALNYGILFLSATIIMLALIVRTTWRLFRSEWTYQPQMGSLVVVLSATLIGLYFPQAMTHNAGILTREPVSVFMLSLFLALEVRRRQNMNLLRSPEIDVAARSTLLLNSVSGESQNGVPPKTEG